MRSLQKHGISDTVLGIGDAATGMHTWNICSFPYVCLAKWWGMEVPRALAGPWDKGHIFLVQTQALAPTGTKPTVTTHHLEAQGWRTGWRLCWNTEGPSDPLLSC